MFQINSINPWVWKAHPEVWVLVIAVSLLGFWAVKVIGPKVVDPGQKVVSKRQKITFIVATVLLFVSADWPLHDIAEDHLYSAHMLQHLLITFIIPPLFLLSIPMWLANLLVVSDTFSSQIIRKLSHPVVAGVIFNALVALTHWSGFVQFSADSGIFHYTIHVLLFITALLMWLPVVSPIPELRLSLPGQMIYLFLMSIIPTVPAAWLTFAEGTVYNHYDDGYQMWGISVQSDQQAAGLIMKLLGGFYLWGIIVFKFYIFAREHTRNQNMKTISTRN
ncbi:MAG: cytochrome c oxidase assembly protein [Acidimicrobiales bacterium]|nr:cytochrome c oxidase assembly protein [Acidimicrobiales bacterium]